MEMHQVRYFLAVAQELNFSRAAEKCNVSQPALSRAIQLLEGELGGSLFHRERHLTHLTELGEMVRPHLETVYEAPSRQSVCPRRSSSSRKCPLTVLCRFRRHFLERKYLTTARDFVSTPAEGGKQMQTLSRRDVLQAAAAFTTAASVGAVAPLVRPLTTSNFPRLLR
jgi:hypothetical protein